MRRTILADSLLVFVFTAVLIWPLFRLKYLDNWPSIESTFISDARMLGENLPHPGWQPLWYCGNRYDYIYPPALRYGPMLIAKATRMTTARAYHLYTAFFYAFGIVAVYWMVLVGSASRMGALLAAAAAALLSPSFALLSNIRHDSAFWVPQRLHALMLWGEGPHISALCILPAALAASFLALRKWRPGMFAAAAALSALVVSNNFYGATSLAIFFSVAAWAIWNGERDWRVLPRAAGIAALSWGLCAFWLTPSYLKLTLLNMKWVTPPDGGGWKGLAPIALALFGILTWRVGKGRRDRVWPVFIAGVTLILSLEVLGYYYIGFVWTGDPPRLIPELDLALIFVFAEIVRAVWRRPKWRIAAAIVVTVAFLPSLRYLRHAWTPFPRSGPLESQYAYRMTKWVSDNLPGERVLPSGELRFWFDAWDDNAMTDGISAQGMENQVIPDATWQIHVGDQPGLAIAWLQALGTDAVIVADEKSLEYYRSDYRHPGKFAGAVPVLFDDQHGTVVYRVPRIYPNIGRIVDSGALRTVGIIRSGDDAETLGKYVAVVENPDQPRTAVAWHGFDEVDVQAKTTQGSSVLLQETWDTAWHAFEGGKELPIRREPLMGFMLIDVPPGDHAIRMRFQTPLENRTGQCLLVLSLLVLAGLTAAGLGVAGFADA